MSITNVTFEPIAMAELIYFANFIAGDNNIIFHYIIFLVIELSINSSLEAKLIPAHVRRQNGELSAGGSAAAASIGEMSTANDGAGGNSG